MLVTATIVVSLATAGTAVADPADNGHNCRGVASATHAVSEAPLFGETAGRDNENAPVSNCGNSGRRNQ